MNTWHVKSLGCLLAVSNVALADASYQETTQITGGQLVDTLKSVPFMPKSMKKMFEPINSLKMLHGNQLASVSRTSTEVIDLDQETITRIDSEKKTYTVVTFAQMRQAMLDAPKKLEQAQAQIKQQQAAHPQADQPPADAQASQIQVTYEVSVTDTGQSKAVNGVMSKEQLLTMKAHVSDPNAQPSAGPSTITYSYIADIWTAPEPPEMKQIDDFFLRYGKKMMQGIDAAALMKSMKPAISGSAIAPLFANNPGMGPAMQEMMKKMATEMQKIKGTPILEVTRLGGDTMTVTPGATVATPPPAPPNAAGTAATQVATSTATDVASSEASKLGTVGAAFGRSLMGAFHKPSTPAPANAAAPGEAPGPAASSAILYETTTQKSDFSQEAIPPSAFQIPAGFSKVDSNFDGQQTK